MAPRTFDSLEVYTEATSPLRANFTPTVLISPVVESKKNYDNIFSKTPTNVCVTRALRFFHIYLHNQLQTFTGTPSTYAFQM
jgi:hypothetical protein